MGEAEGRPGQPPRSAASDPRLREAEVRRYLALVAHDARALALLSRAADREDVSDWQCTLLYYMACVYVKALGRFRQVDLQDHFQVKQWLNTSPDLVDVARPYRKLEDRSRDARYEGRRYSRDEQRQHVRWFEEVQDRVSALLRAGGIAGLTRIDATGLL